MGKPDTWSMPFLLRATPRLDLAGWTLRSEVNQDGDRAFGRHTRPDPERYEHRNVLASHPPSGQSGAVSDPTPWLVFGVDLRFTTTEEGRRTKPLSAAPYTPMQYRPNWRLPGMNHPDQVGAPVLCFEKFPLHPGDRTHAVIVPLAPGSMPLWHRVSLGDELTLYEGPQVCGHANVLWIASTTLPLPAEDQESFDAWCSKGPPPKNVARSD